MNTKTIENIYELSPMQQGILFHSLYAPDSDPYFVQFCCTLSGKLNLTLFEQAWQQVIDRHSILRTSFHWEELEKPLQVVHPRVPVPLEQYNWSNLSSDEQQKQREDFLKADHKRGFNFGEPPLMRLTLIELARETYLFIWSKHHLILDGWSSARVLKEVFESYEALLRGQDCFLFPPGSYSNYIAWLQHQDLSVAEQFWRQNLKGFTAPTSLKVNQPSANSEPDYHRQRIQLSLATTEALQALAKQHQLTLNTIVQGAYALLLTRYSGEKDIIFGSVVSGRPADLVGVESMVGLFINTLPVRVQLTGEEKVLTWLQKLQSQQLELRQYEYSPLVQIQGWSEIPRGVPLFDSIIIFENYPVDKSLLSPNRSLEVGEISYHEMPTYPLEITVVLDKQLCLQAGFDRRYFDPSTIRRILQHLQTLLEEMIAKPMGCLADLSLNSQAEQQQLLVDWNNTYFDHPLNSSIIDLFEDQVEQTPDAVALIYQDQHLTYRELNQRANQLGHTLKQRGIGPEVIVGLCVERSLDMIVGLLGILKAGGAYLPLDIAYPQERIAFMMQEGQVPLLLTQQRLLDQLPPTDAEILCLDRDWDLIAIESTLNPVNETTPHHLAYVIYTSGSTGQPKGVMIQHRSLVNYILTATDYYGISPSDRVLQFASISFDVATEEIFSTLIRGATLILRTDEMLNTLSQFLQQCEDFGITVLDLPTAYWHQLTDELTAGAKLPESLRLVIIGGEMARLNSLSAWQQQVRNSVRLVNSYGPTETTIGATIWELTAEKEIGSTVPIGRPIHNLQVYLLDSSLNPVPIGVTGEIYIGGVGVARGYLNRPQLTAEKFISDPFSKKPGARLYKTGDLARYLENGDLEYLGRSDRQVKVRGFRIELGEIESVLNSHEMIKEAVITAQKDRLIAYLVPTQKQFFIKEIQSFLKDKLPPYMIPSAFFLLDKIPLTPNNKIDHKALNTLEKNQLIVDSPRGEPKTLTEKKLAEIWLEILKVNPIGIHDNFFELGGHSLLATQVISRIREAFMLELPLRTLFESPTIAELAQKIETSQKTEEHSLDTIVSIPRQTRKTKLRS